MDFRLISTNTGSSIRLAKGDQFWSQYNIQADEIEMHLKN